MLRNKPLYNITNMGNCFIGGSGGGNNKSVIRVITSQGGGVMEFYQPITVESITDEFPGHGIFRSHGIFWKPLPHCEQLIPGESYHLLPLLGNNNTPSIGYVRSNSVPQHSSYRMSSFNSTKKMLPEERKHSKVWKVKLVISQKQLMEILSEEERTEELIESVRTVAKCRSVSGGSSDGWSHSSSRKAPSSNKDVFLDS